MIEPEGFEAVILYTISLAGIPLRLDCHFPYAMLEDFNTAEEAKEIITVEPNSAAVSQRYVIPPEWESPRNAELIQMIGDIGSALLRYDRCILHGTAFIWHDKAWIFTAPSGVGKTTQYIRWKLLYKDEVSILNGDKPILEFREDDAVIVHPSPWKGKENMGTMRSAPLGGIILLRQGAENRVQKLSPSSAVLPLYTQFMFFVNKAENVDRVCMLETRLLKTYPIWELINLGDEASAKLMHDTLMKWEQQ